MFIDSARLMNWNIMAELSGGVAEDLRLTNSEYILLLLLPTSAQVQSTFNSEKP
uniref:AlNc14C95G5827 protein n=1 Tax=Albugo laibachii Nc14 TaxID=890382 RepID=F0WGV1_9STRA|nr:AlNc14C95G5827 [Albugo laibachii Nc14]|eukprot:CCA20466.1 AlNc14C95G5827 [Albugo laibachii Nc14]